MSASLEAELRFREKLGIERVTIAELDRRLAALGYKRDGSACHGTSRWLTGERAGESYPAITYGVSEIDTGMSAFNVDARRDANFKAMQEMRFNEVYAVADGSIVTI